MSEYIIFFFAWEEKAVKGTFVLLNETKSDI